MKKINCVLIIDMQVDFCNPNGSLFVKGAVEDCQRLSSWLRDNKNEIDSICTTLDSHSVLDIAHPGFWVDKDGKNPPAFTIITAADVRAGKWSARFRAPDALAYLDALEAQGEFPNCIWPEHCIIGTKGHALEDNVSDAIREWERLGNFRMKFVTKGTNPLTEHFGAFVAQVQYPNADDTQLNQRLIQNLSEYQNVYLAGEAKSHCVANTLKQAMIYAPELAKKFIILEDTMSPVPNFEHLADSIYDDARKLGVRFSTTAKEKLGKAVLV